MEGLLVAEDDGQIWLKGNSAVINLENSLRQLPVRTTFLADEHKNLFVPGKLTPVDRLKDLQWMSLMEFIKVEPPTAALPGKQSSQLKVKLIPSEKERPGKALLTSLEAWKQFAETAPATRLEAWKFAVSEKNEVLIIGIPLPSLPGKEYWAADDLLIPSGYDFESDLLPRFASQKLCPGRNAYIVFDIDGCYQKIEKEFFVNAIRSAVRLTGRIINY